MGATNASADECVKHYTGMPDMSDHPSSVDIQPNLTLGKRSFCAQDVI